MAKQRRLVSLGWFGPAILVGLLLVANPCFARLTLGWVKDGSGPIDNPQAAAKLAGLLEQSLAEEVRERPFSSETVLHDWLNRFREVDVAFLSREYLAQQSSVEFYFVADYYLADEGGIAAPYRVVARKWLTASRIKQLQQAFSRLQDLPAAQDFLKQHDLRGFVLPGQEPPAEFLVPFSKPQPQVIAPVAKPAPAPSEKEKPVKPVEPEPASKPVSVEKSLPVAPEPKPAESQAAEKTPVAPTVVAAPQGSENTEAVENNVEAISGKANELPEAGERAAIPTTVSEQTPDDIQWGWQEYLFGALIIVLLLGGLLQSRRRRKERLVQEWLPNLVAKPSSPAASAKDLPATHSVKDAFTEALAAATDASGSTQSVAQAEDSEGAEVETVDTLSIAPPIEEKKQVPVSDEPFFGEDETENVVAPAAEMGDEEAAGESAAETVEDELPVETVSREEEPASQARVAVAEFEEDFAGLTAETQQPSPEPVQESVTPPVEEVKPDPAEKAAKTSKTRRKRKKSADMVAEPLPMPRQPVSPSQPALANESEVPAVEATDDTVTAQPAELAPFQLHGDLGAAQVVAVLQMMATYPKPVSLVIRNPHYEKRFYFREGHVVQVSSLNRVKKSKANFLMNKLGYILVRERKISEEQRDSALDLCEENPKLRIGEALVQLGALSKPELLDALRRQAEGVVFSLFLFPEGEYELIEENLDIPADDDLLMPVNGLLQEAAQNASEWDRIRTAIPSLSTVLDFSPSGREKSDNARLTVHQKMVLALVDGKRSVQDICVEATMLDFEVYRFLYLMLYAKILRRADH